MALLKYAGIIIGLFTSLYLTKIWLSFAYQVEWPTVLNRLVFGDVSWGLRLFAALGYTLCLVWFSSMVAAFIDTPLLKHYGQNTQMVYAGNSLWYKAPGHNATKKAKATSISSDDSFTDIYQERTFRGVSPKSGDYGYPTGQVANKNTLAMLIAFLIWSVFLTAIAMGSLHIFAWEAQGLNPNVPSLSESPSEAFEKLLLNIKLSKGIYGVTLLLAPLFGIIIGIAFPSTVTEPKYDPSALRVKSDQKLQGKVTGYQVIKAERIAMKSNHKDPDRYYYVDEGDRKIVVEFSRIYPAPVYVSYRYNALDNPSLDNVLKMQEENASHTSFKVNQDFTISPMER